jgi:hypothetical protein
MTKITEALAPIGGQAQLYTLAADVLRANDIDIDRSLGAFVARLTNDAAMLSALACKYLTDVAADMRNAARAKNTVTEASPAEATTTLGQGNLEAHSAYAEGRPSPMATDAGGHQPKKTKKQRVVHSRGREGPHRRHMPTLAQRKAEIAVSQSTTLFDSWTVRGNRKIGGQAREEQEM